MGAIFGVAGVVVLVALIAVLWMTGAMRPKARDKAGPSARATTEKGGRSDGID